MAGQQPTIANNSSMPGVLNKYRQPLYDYQVYAAAGQNSMTFMQTPQGQGGRTFSDTNMVAAGMLPAPQKFDADGIEVLFVPGAGVPVSTFGAEAAAKFINDVAAVYLQPARLVFTIGQMAYAFDSPLVNFAPRRWLDGFAAAADASTAGANLQTVVGYATAKGEPYRIDPIVQIPPNQNFTVQITWDNGAVALPSTVAGRIGVRLNGYLYRAVQ